MQGQKILMHLLCRRENQIVLITISMICNFEVRFKEHALKDSAGEMLNRKGPSG